MDADLNKNASADVTTEAQPPAQGPDAQLVQTETQDQPQLTEEQIVATAVDQALADAELYANNKEVMWTEQDEAELQELEVVRYDQGPETEDLARYRKLSNKKYKAEEIETQKMFSRPEADLTAEDKDKMTKYLNSNHVDMFGNFHGRGGIEKIPSWFQPRALRGFEGFDSFEKAYSGIRSAPFGAVNYEAETATAAAIGPSRKEVTDVVFSMLKRMESPGLDPQNTKMFLDSLARSLRKMDIDQNDKSLVAFRDMILGAVDQDMHIEEVHFNPRKTVLFIGQIYKEFDFLGKAPNKASENQEIGEALVRLQNDNWLFSGYTKDRIVKFNERWGTYGGTYARGPAVQASTAIATDSFSESLTSARAMIEQARQNINMANNRPQQGAAVATPQAEITQQDPSLQFGAVGSVLWTREQSRLRTEKMTEERHAKIEQLGGQAGELVKDRVKYEMEQELKQQGKSASEINPEELSKRQEEAVTKEVTNLEKGARDLASYKIDKNNPDDKNRAVDNFVINTLEDFVTKEHAAAQEREQLKESEKQKEPEVKEMEIGGPEIEKVLQQDSLNLDAKEPIKNDIELLVPEVSLPAKDNNKQQDNSLKVEEGLKFDDKLFEVAQSEEVQDIIKRMLEGGVEMREGQAKEKTVDVSAEKPQAEKVDASSVKDALGDDSWLDKTSNEKHAPEEENSQGGRGV